MSRSPTRVAARSRRLAWSAAAIALIGSIAMLAAPRAGRATWRTVAGDPGSAAIRGVVVPAALPPEPAGSPGTLPAGALRLEGQVVDDGRQPVGGARVSLGDRSVVTEADGAFAFDGLAAGRYRVAAERGDGYAEDQRVDLDDASEPIVLILVRGPTLVVHAVERDRRPIAGATVEIGARRFVTADDGAARIRGVAGDDEFVTVSAPGHVRVHDRVVTSDDPAETVEWTAVLDPGADVTGIVVDDTGARVAGACVELEIELVDGGRSESAISDDTGAWALADVGAGVYRARASSNLHIATADVPVAVDAVHGATGVVVRVRRGGEIAGVVLDTAGRPIADARVSAAGGGGDTTDAGGRFTIRGLAPETYSVTADAHGLGAARQDVVVAPGRNAEARFVLAPSSLAGIVVDARGEPVDDAKVIASSDVLGAYDITHADAWGHFDLGGVVPGRYQIVARRPGSSVDGPAVEVTPSDRHIRLVVPDPAEITGRVVLDGAPVTYFGVAIDEGADGGVGSVLPVRDRGGRFRIRDAPVGTRAIIVIGPDFVRRVVEVHAVGGETVDLGDIAVAGGGRVRGRVVDASGAGVAGATVRATSAGFSNDETRLGAIRRGEFWATTDATGAFALAGLPDALTGFQIEATHPTRGGSGVQPLPGASAITLVLAGPR